MLKNRCLKYIEHSLGRKSILLINKLKSSLCTTIVHLMQYVLMGSKIAVVQISFLQGSSTEQSCAMFGFTRRRVGDGIFCVLPHKSAKWPENSFYGRDIEFCLECQQDSASWYQEDSASCSIRRTLLAVLSGGLCQLQYQEDSASCSIRKTLLAVVSGGLCQLLYKEDSASCSIRKTLLYIV